MTIIIDRFKLFVYNISVNLNRSKLNMKKLQIKKWLMNKHWNALNMETVYINKQTVKALGVGLENGRVLFWLPKSQLMNWDEYSKQLGDKLNSIELVCEGVE